VRAGVFWLVGRAFVGGLTNGYKRGYKRSLQTVQTGDPMGGARAEQLAKEIVSALYERWATLPYRERKKRRAQFRRALTSRRGRD
jgi:hypothetical protein